jgi:hypothetical protein
MSRRQEPTEEASLPKVIPPRSRFRLVRSDRRTPAWKDKVGRIYRIGYYSRRDGLKDIWLVNEAGTYIGTVGRDMLRRYFELITLSHETSRYGEGRPAFRPLRTTTRRSRHS